LLLISLKFYSFEIEQKICSIFGSKDDLFDHLELSVSVQIDNPFAQENIFGPLKDSEVKR